MRCRHRFSKNCSGTMCKGQSYSGKVNWCRSFSMSKMTSVSGPYAAYSLVNRKRFSKSGDEDMDIFDDEP